MSRRTALASKAVNEAWKNEQSLVQEGKGTRDWSPDQQRDILEKGKAYDENGKAFEGHHQKSVEKYPEYQGDAENIQFLSRAEHTAAHNGSFQNPTNGYYDPYTGETKDFGDGKYEPCEIIELTEPIVPIATLEPIVNEKQTPEIDLNGEPLPRGPTIPSNIQRNQTPAKAPTQEHVKTYVPAEKTSFWSRAASVGKRAFKWVVEHPVESFMIGYGVYKGGRGLHSLIKGKGSKTVIHVTKPVSITPPTRPSIPTSQPSVTSEGITDIIESVTQATGRALKSGLSDQSFLSRAGYSSFADKTVRQEILRKVVDAEGKKKTIDLLQFLIRMRSTQQNGALKYKRAIDIWQQDIDFLTKL